MTNLRAMVLDVLERHDGYCLDTAEERDHLASALTGALGGAQYLAVMAEGGLLTGATIWRTLERAEHAARDFLAVADLDTDDAAVLRVTPGQVDIVTTAKALLAGADQ